MTSITDTRIIQQKKKDDDSIYVNISSKKAGLSVGDVVKVEYIGNGIVIIKKMYDTNIIENESLLNRMLESFGLKKHKNAIVQCYAEDLESRKIVSN
ncbi:MAG: hypothetical protein PHP08_00570 [Candidatus Dojkabacteria bacterium]|nr:hypothetical protein [Candidatus Dojkabacteria bacterium]